MSKSEIPARETRPVAAALFMLGACSFFAFNSIFVKLAADTGLHPFQIAFFRNFFALLIILPIAMIRTGPDALIPNRPGLLALRGGLNGASMLAWFYAVPLMAITDLTAIGFTGPIWATLLAALVLKEKMRLRRWTAIGIGVLGAAIVVRPGFQEINSAVYLVLFSSAMWGATLIVIRRLTSVEQVDTILIYQALAMALIAAGPMIFVWQNPTPEGWLWMGVLGVLAMGAHSLHVRAFSMQEVSALQPLDFSRFPFSALGAFFILGEVMSPWTGFGAVVVFAAGFYISRREAQLAKTSLKPTTTSPQAAVVTEADRAAAPPVAAAATPEPEPTRRRPRSTGHYGRWGPSPTYRFMAAQARLLPGLRPRPRPPTFLPPPARK